MRVKSNVTAMMATIYLIRPMQRVPDLVVRLERIKMGNSTH
jgi:hypothetical protein